MSHQETLTLEEIAKLVDEFQRLRKIHPEQGSENFRRIIRVGDILNGISLTGDQIVNLQDYGYSVVTNDHVKGSILYTELQREYDKLEQKYERLEARYHALVRQAESDFRPDFRLKELIDKQQQESLGERD